MQNKACFFAGSDGYGTGQICTGGASEAWDRLQKGIRIDLCVLCDGAYRNERGKPTCDRISIGRLDEETEKLMPNRNYYEVYLKKPMPECIG